MVRINSTSKTHLVVFDPPLLMADPRFIVAGTIGALGPDYGVVLDGGIIFSFL